MWALHRQARHLAGVLAARGCCEAAAGPAASGARGAKTLAGAEPADAKREKRRRRRRTNQELKERMEAENGWGWHCGGQARPQQRGGSAKQRTNGAAQDSRAEELGFEWQVLCALLGRPCSKTEKRKYARVVRDWQAAFASAEDDAASRSSGSKRTSSSSGGEWEGWSSGRGSAGASAGPRWGQASWTWADFRQAGPASSSSSSHSREWHSAWFHEFGSSGWEEDEEAWYEVPPRSGRGRRRAAGASFGGWGWFGMGQEHGGGSSGGGWRHGSTGGSSSSSGGTLSHIRVLGLESSWLGSRCRRLLKQAYLAKAKALHPDVHAASGDAQGAAAAEARFKEVQGAYEALLPLAAQPAS